MNKYDLAVQTIKDRVSALDVAETMGLEIRHGRCQCPLHGGKDFNCVVYKGSRGYYCHVCKAGGDVISFARQYYGMTFKDTVAWFNSTFNLCLNLDGKIDPEKQKQAEKALQRRKNAIAFREWKERMQFDLSLTADEIVWKLKDVRDDNMPRTPDQEWNEAFRTAVKLLPEARLFAEECRMNSMKVAQERKADDG